MPDEWAKDYWEALLAGQLPQPSQRLTPGPYTHQLPWQACWQTPSLTADYQLSTEVSLNGLSFVKVPVGPSDTYQSNEGAELRKSHIPRSTVTCSDGHCFPPYNTKRQNIKEEKNS